MNSNLHTHKLIYLWLWYGKKVVSFGLLISQWLSCALPTWRLWLWMVV